MLHGPTSHRSSPGAGWTPQQVANHQKYERIGRDCGGAAHEPPTLIAFWLAGQDRHAILARAPREPPVGVKVSRQTNHQILARLRLILGVRAFEPPRSIPTGLEQRLRLTRRAGPRQGASGTAHDRQHDRSCQKLVVRPHVLASLANIFTTTAKSAYTQKSAITSWDDRITKSLPNRAPLAPSIHEPRKPGR